MYLQALPLIKCAIFAGLTYLTYRKVRKLKQIQQKKFVSPNECTLKQIIRKPITSPNQQQPNPLSSQGNIKVLQYSEFVSAYKNIPLSQNLEEYDFGENEYSLQIQPLQLEKWEGISTMAPDTGRSRWSSVDSQEMQQQEYFSETGEQQQPINHNKYLSLKLLWEKIRNKKRKCLKQKQKGRIRKQFYAKKKADKD